MTPPAGWKLVPIEPTQEMLSASWAKANPRFIFTDHEEHIAAAYRAMLDAAPAQPAPEVVAYCFRFHTDDSLRGMPNVRRWTLMEGKPRADLTDEGEVRLLVEAELPAGASPMSDSDSVPL